MICTPSHQCSDEHCTNPARYTVMSANLVFAATCGVHLHQFVEGFGRDNRVVTVLPYRMGGQGEMVTR